MQQHIGKVYDDVLKMITKKLKKVRLQLWPAMDKSNSKKPATIFIKESAPKH